jgi:F-type H+-transporting ATPase subunit delta
MNEGLISKRYARALYRYAEERNEEKALYDRMQTLLANLRTMPRLYATLCSPMVPAEEKTNLLHSAAGPGPEESYLGFVRLALENHRERSLDKIALSYADYYLQQKHITVVNLTFAEAMPTALLTRMRDDFSRITQGEVQLSVKIDPAICGGFVCRIGDRRLDASVTGQLALMRQQILQENKYIS